MLKVVSNTLIAVVDQYEANSNKNERLLLYIYNLLQKLFETHHYNITADPCK